MGAGGEKIPLEEIIALASKLIHSGANACTARSRNVPVRFLTARIALLPIISFAAAR